MQILAIGLNPAYQKTLTFQKLTINDVNRATNMSVGIGGKGQQFASALNILYPSSAVVAQFVGGDTGKFISSTLERANIQLINVHTLQPTRTCITLLCEETGQMTELIEPSGEISPTESDQMLKKIIDKLPQVQGVALCGTYPPGIKEEFIIKIAENKPPGVLLLLDGYKGVDGVLKSKKVDIIKINVNELNSLTKEKSLVKGANMLLQNYNVKYVALTAGPDQAHLFSKDFHIEYDIPKLKIKNPIGAGDTVSAVLLGLLCSGIGVTTSFRQALGAGCASCLNIQGAKYDLMMMQQIASKITYKKVIDSFEARL